MDEPTNHLDMESIESLNLALENFPGTIFFVSHDQPQNDKQIFLEDRGGLPSRRLQQLSVMI